MPSDPVIFDAKSAVRIAAAVKAVEMGRNPDQATLARGVLANPFWAKITSTYNATTGYNWTMQKPNATGGWADDTPTGNYLFDPNGDTGIAIGEIRFIEPRGETSGHLPIFHIISAGGNLFPVLVTKTSGAAGDAAGPCTYVYTVKDLAGNTLATGQSPAWARPPYGKMSIATHGTAYYTAGSIVLHQVDEQPGGGEC